jgi:hypothetical protein
MNRAPSDRNLLFGILALQLNFIGRDALIHAMSAWVLAKHRPLGDILFEQGALSTDSRDALERFVEKHLHKHGGDVRRSLAAIVTPGALRESLRQIADADLQASVAGLSTVEDPGRTEPYVPSEPSAVGAPTSANMRFQIVRPHARGGLGEVFVALDGELNRQVALKEIRQDHAADANSRARFLLEAEITGGLEHPGIVPVYGLGRYPDGRPFYAMRLIKGQSLKDAIERYHQHSGRRESADDMDVQADADRSPALELRQMLDRFFNVCNAIAYGHSRGVLHKDHTQARPHRVGHADAHRLQAQSQKVESDPVRRHENQGRERLRVRRSLAAPRTTATASEYSPGTFVLSIPLPASSRSISRSRRRLRPGSLPGFAVPLSRPAPFPSQLPPVFPRQSAVAPIHRRARFRLVLARRSIPTSSVASTSAPATT